MIVAGLGSLVGISIFLGLWFWFQSQTEKIWAQNLGSSHLPTPLVLSKKETARLLTELADFLDLMGLGMSGGLNLQDAWRLGADHAQPGPLKKELGRVQEALFLGRPREDAFQELDRRLGQPHLHLFFSLLVHSVRAGNRLQTLFHDQAASLRRARLMQIERRAQTAPLRLLFPLFLFIFPTLFLILFGPLVIRVSQGGGLF